MLTIIGLRALARCARVLSPDISRFRCLLLRGVALDLVYRLLSSDIWQRQFGISAERER